MSARVRHIAIILLSLIVGGTFIFSGFVKSVDPVGTSIFVEKYLATYSLEVLLPMALAIAVVLGVVELLLGILLVANAYRPRAACAATLFLTLFTIVTLLNATILPIGDCGCFGDAVTLSPWQTFIKNIVLLPMAYMLWRLCRGEHDTAHSLETAVVALLFAVGVNGTALRFLPLIDFLSYKKGVDLRAEVGALYAAERESVRSVLLFKDKTTGESVEFSADAVECWSDDNLEYVDAYTKHDEVPMSDFVDFRVYDMAGEDVTVSLLERTGRVVWLCINDTKTLEGRRLRDVQEMITDDVVVVTAGDTGHLSTLLGTPCYAMDAMTMRSFIRADAGVVVVTDGVITHKSNVRDYKHAIFNLNILQ